jgi:hypothetical protein
MSEEQQIVLEIRRMISSMSKATQSQIELASGKLLELQLEYGDAARFAIALAGAEMALK